MPSIGSLNEKALHADLKAWYQQPGDQIEVAVDGYVIDIVRGDVLIEIQTRNFSALKTKLRTLLAHHPIRLVYPISQQKWLVKRPTNSNPKTSRRKSPKRGEIMHLFNELVHLPKVLTKPNFSLHVLMIEEEEQRRYDGKRGWRRKGWVTHERRLLRVVEEHVFETPQDMASLLPSSLPTTFTTADLANALNTTRRFAQKVAYCLARMEIINRVGKKGNAVVYKQIIQHK